MDRLIEMYNNFLSMLVAETSYGKLYQINVYIASQNLSLVKGDM